VRGGRARRFVALAATVAARPMTMKCIFRFVCQGSSQARCPVKMGGGVELSLIVRVRQNFGRYGGR
jgi:hypothetical protein